MNFQGNIDSESGGKGSGEQIHQIEAKALRKLRHPSNNRIKSAKSLPH